MSITTPIKNISKEERPLTYRYTLKIFFNGGVLLAITFYFLANLKDPSLIEFLTFPMMLIFGSLTVWLVHKYPLHRRLSVFPYAYRKHTIEHHSLYTYHDLEIKNFKEIPYIMFGVLDVIGFALVFVPIMYFINSLIFSENVVNMIIASSSGYFLIYEFFHTISHLPSNHPILKVRYFKFMWNHHRIHHHPRAMNSTNFNIVFPIFDYLFGTLKKDLPVDFKIKRSK